MGLRDKTQKKFLDFFTKMVQTSGSNVYEVAYSEIQRETGSANATLKRALKALVDDGIITINAGHNSRYAKITYLLAKEKNNADNTPKDADGSDSLSGTMIEPDTAAPNISTINQESSSQVNQVELLNQVNELNKDVKELIYLVENLRRRARTQEMTIALLQDRLAELEDKLHKH